jgi:hypothetical protein
MTLWKRLAYLFPWRRRAADRDMQEELRSIAAMAEPGELGNLTLAAEDARAEWGWTWLERVGQDVRYASRILRNSPAFAATAVLSLALGIGANSAIFAALDAAFWKPLPVADAQSLVNFSITRVRGGDETDLPAGLARRLRLARSRKLSLIPANEQAGGEPSVTGDRRTGPRSSRAR